MQKELFQVIQTCWDWRSFSERFGSVWVNPERHCLNIELLIANLGIRTRNFGHLLESASPSFIPVSHGRGFIQRMDQQTVGYSDFRFPICQTKRCCCGEVKIHWCGKGKDQWEWALEFGNNRSPLALSHISWKPLKTNQSLPNRNIPWAGLGEDFRVLRKNQGISLFNLCSLQALDRCEHKGPQNPRELLFGQPPWPVWDQEGVRGLPTAPVPAGSSSCTILHLQGMWEMPRVNPLKSWFRLTQVRHRCLKCDFNPDLCNSSHAGLGVWGVFDGRGSTKRGFSLGQSCSHTLGRWCWTFPGHVCWPNSVSGDIFQDLLPVSGWFSHGTAPALWWVRSCIFQ